MHRSLSARLLVLIWWLFSCLALVAFVVEWVHRAQSMINMQGMPTNINELSMRGDFNIGVVNGGSSSAWFQVTQNKQNNRSHLFDRMLLMNLMKDCGIEWSKIQQSHLSAVIRKV